MFQKTNCFSEYKFSRYFTQIRNARKEHWTVVQRGKRPMDKAIEHFDDFYKSVFGDRLWRSLRLGLYSPNKYAAVINNFCDPDAAKTELENRGAINLRTLIELQKVRLLEIDEEKKQKPTFDVDEKMDAILEQSNQMKYENQEENVDPSLQIFRNMYLEEKLESYVGKLSLEEGMKDAQFDESRIIHPDNEMSYTALNEFTPATKLKGLDEYIPESKHYSYYSTTIDFPITIQDDEKPINIPPHLDIYIYEKCNVTPFPQPKRRHTNTLDYYLLDGASVLPVIALDLKVGDRLLDMCSAPGGKAYTAFQTLYLDNMVCNDIIESRVNRIKRVLDEYFTDGDWRKKIQVTKQNAMSFYEDGVYNKILVDVPCTNDRNSLREKENNMFSSHRIQERLTIPELQADLLMTALKAVAVGGTVVYSTCSLSPIQNDGVVQMALRKLWIDTNHQFSIINIQKSFLPAKIAYYFCDKVEMKYGLLVLPHLTANFGPLYVSKIVRTR